MQPESQRESPNATPTNWATPTELCLHGVILKPLSMEHEAGLRTAATDGELWQLKVTSVPEPDQVQAYIQKALTTPDRLAFVVIDQVSQRILGSTSYHDILPDVKRLEIGYTWYAKSAQRTHVNTTCKLILMTHAFETLNARVVGWRTDILNYASQNAIERLGAQKDGVIRGNMQRRDGTVRDTVMYSMTQEEWPAAKAKLLQKLATYLPK